MTEENWLLSDEIDYQYVIGQDPGGTTGIALLRYTENTLPELVYLHQIPDGREGFFYFFIGSEVGEGTNFTSVSEKWETREGVHGANLEPVYIEGVQYAIWVDQTVYQSPSVKNMVGDEFLKVNNLWTEGKRHQMDALLHAIYYLRNIGHEPTLQALAGEAGKPLAEPGEAEEKTLPQPGEGEPGGEGGGGAGAGQGFIEAMEAMKRLAEAIDAAGSEVSQETELGIDYGDLANTLNPEGDKPKRSLNGAFIGFEDDD